MFIAIEGADGSGKAEQSKRLVTKLGSEGFKTVFFDFPQYEGTYFGEMIGKMLAGKYGSMESINPYLASLPYAFDRWEASKTIRKATSEGKIVVANRFTLSNLAHQGARVPVQLRDEFINHVLKLENKILEIPIPDLYLHLDVPSEISQELIVQKLQRKYLNDKGNKDLLERDVAHQVEAARMYGELSSLFPNMVRINCCDESGKLRSIDEIHQLVWNETSKHIHSDQEGRSVTRKESDL